MKKIILVRLGEVFLKGKNRGWFEGLILNNLKAALAEYGCMVKKTSGRYIIDGYAPEQEDEIIAAADKVFGLHSLSRAAELATDKQTILNYIKTINLNNHTFKVATNRADKKFCYTSQQFSAIAGEAALAANPAAKVDVHNPQVTINIDIRENKKTYIFFDAIMLRGGLPVGSGGKCLVLLSGGIDSPVAAYMMACRGMRVGFLHFHSYPYTSTQARDKVVNLTKILEGYTGKGKLFIANIKKLQEEINAHCNNSYMITIMRRVMMNVAADLARRHGYDCIVTGESLGQVASQTIESITLTNMAAGNVPVLRPLVALDKTEIIKIAQDIGTYKTSVLPYEDCCTVFLPKNPIIRPNLLRVQAEERKLNLDALTNEILKSAEILN